MWRVSLTMLQFVKHPPWPPSFDNGTPVAGRRLSAASTDGRVLGPGRLSGPSQGQAAPLSHTSDAPLVRLHPIKVVEPVNLGPSSLSRAQGPMPPQDPAWLYVSRAATWVGPPFVHTHFRDIGRRHIISKAVVREPKLALAKAAPTQVSHFQPPEQTRGDSHDPSTLRVLALSARSFLHRSILLFAFYFLFFLGPPVCEETNRLCHTECNN